MLEIVKNNLKTLISKNLNYDNIIIEEPKKGYADLAIPLFNISKNLNKDINSLYNDLNTLLTKNKYVTNVEFLNGFLNIFLDRFEYSLLVFKNIKNSYKQINIKNPQTIVIDYSSPNIAKHFSIGHLRSTIIGNSLKKIYSFLGYKVIGINHLGDWGTQFGKMIVAYNHWGNPSILESNDVISQLQNLYVRFHEESKNDLNLETEAREVFLALEKGDKVYHKLWELFKEKSLEEFLQMYKTLNVEFDYFTGESFFNDKMDKVLDDINSKGLSKIDDGALIVDLGENIAPALLKKSDGATLYLTRDLTALLYRYNTYHFNKILYVVGNEQKFHFEQLKLLSKKIGYDFDLEHINFGLVLIDGKKMSTRQGGFAKLDDIIKYTISAVENQMLEKNPNISNVTEIASTIGIGAIIFNDLKNERILDIDFDLENMLKFEGQTGPYIQYTSVRISSILKNYDLNDLTIDFELYMDDLYFELIKVISRYD
ncbi:MAG: arginine--tRNA ligase, partial [Acholeplasmatales bacterium]|nr:arginine--tRNA ligase [Acholeplasmatales bacterium]